MAFVAFDGSPLNFIGWNILDSQTASAGTVDATNESVAMIGHLYWEDGGTHTVDTTGSSSLQWRTNAVTNANGGTTTKVGLADVITTAGPPARANHASDVISFDVAAVFTGGGGGITATAWNTSVPTTGTKTIAHNQLVAFAIQMTARGGADSIVVLNTTMLAATNRPQVTTFASGSYSAATAAPNCIVVANDGTIGWLFGSILHSVTASNRTFNNASSPNEYGQLFDLPVGTKVHGIYAMVDPDADGDFVLYADPLGTPAIVRTASLDLNTAVSANFQRIYATFDTPYTVNRRTKIAAISKPTSGSSLSIRYRTFADAAHRVTEIGGTKSYGVSRSGGSGAFSAENSNLDTYYLGLLCSHYDHGIRPVGGLGI